MNEFKIGFGTDLHKLVKSRKLIIGGIEIPAEKGALAHSDGDVLIHSLVDAILGALGLGDIGEHFPDSDMKFKDKSSDTFLLETLKMLNEQGYKIVNIDSVIHLEKPKLSPYKLEIKKNIAKILGIPENAVNIKAKTRENLDSVGENLAIEALSIVLIAEQS